MSVGSPTLPHGWPPAISFAPPASLKPYAVILEGKTLRAKISPEQQFGGAWKACLTLGKWHSHCATLFRSACGNELNDPRNELWAQSHGELGCEVID